VERSSKRSRAKGRRAYDGKKNDEHGESGGDEANLRRRSGVVGPHLFWGHFKAHALTTNFDSKRRERSNKGQTRIGYFGAGAIRESCL